MRNRVKPLTVRKVETINTAGRFGDGGRGGFGLYLRAYWRANGRLAKAWAQRVRIGGRVTNLGLGVYPVVTLAEARAKALENFRVVSRGGDPRTPRKAPTFKAAAEKVIALHSEGWKPGSRLPQLWRNSLRDYAFPVIGSKRVNDVTSADVVKVIRPIWHTKPTQAKRVRSRIGAVMAWAIGAGHRQDNPVDAVKGALPSNGNGAKHHRALPHRDVPAALEAVRAATVAAHYRLAVEFLILTAARVGEVTGARWSEIDVEARLWAIPAGRMKAKREHRVPLCDRALEVLAEARRLTPVSDYLFPTTTGKRLALTGPGQLLRDLKVGSTPHGFRSSFRSWCADQGVSKEVAGAALAHVVRGVDGAYQRSDLLDTRRDLMERWGAYAVEGVGA